MRTMIDIYNEWGACLEAAGGGEVSFAGICHKLRVSPADLDALIMQETGMSGEEVLRLYLDIAPNFI